MDQSEKNLDQAAQAYTRTVDQYERGTKTWADCREAWAKVMEAALAFAKSRAKD